MTRKFQVQHYNEFRYKTFKITFVIYFSFHLVFENQVNADGRHNVPIFHSTSLTNNLKVTSPTQAVSRMDVQGNKKTSACEYPL